MLRSNSKKARDNLRQYIMDNFDCSAYTDNAPQTWEGIAAFILDTFNSEYGGEWNRKQYSNHQDRFISWCQCLPSVIDTCYYYNRSAVNDLGNILEESEEEKARFTEGKAENMLSAMIYMELLRGANRIAP